MRAFHYYSLVQFTSPIKTMRGPLAGSWESRCIIGFGDDDASPSPVRRTQAVNYDVTRHEAVSSVAGG
jgi:hypothetical protein